MSIEGKCEKCGGATTDYRCLNCIETELEETKLQIDELKLDLKESSADADALILLSKGLYDRIQGKPDWVVASNCQTALNYIDYLNRLIGEVVAAWKEQKSAVEANVPSGEFREDDRRGERVSMAKKRLELALDAILTPEVKRYDAKGHPIESEAEKIDVWEFKVKDLTSAIQAVLIDGHVSERGSKVLQASLDRTPQESKEFLR